ncbi:MAG: hypothetical protein IH974_10250 [Myxococcales bacterium]|nr:hypothetical protein [Myxococcales bacterium]
MPIELRYRDDGSGVVYICTGVVTAADFFKASEEVYSEERIDRLRYQLVDFTATEHLDSNLEDTRTNAEIDVVAANQNPNFIIAIVGPDDLTFGLSRMWEAMVSHSDLRTRVFRSIPDAERWIKDTLHDS